MNHPMYKFIRETIEFRKKHPATCYGEVKILLSERRGAGLLVYELKCSDETLIIALNTANEPRIANFKTHYTPGITFEPIYNTLAGTTLPLVVREDGYALLRLPGRAFTVFALISETSELFKPNVFVSLNLKSGYIIRDRREIVGETNARTVYVYFDRKVESELKIEPKDGKFSFVIDPFKFDPGEHALLIRAMGRTARDTVYSEEIIFKAELEKRELTYVRDPLDDDIGPKGTYVYPLDPTFKRQMDIVEAKVESIGSTLVISIKPRDLTKSWNPTYGFDHVTYQIFIDDPNKKGVNFLPLQNFEFEDWGWDYEIFATGWQSAIYSSKGTAKNKFGMRFGSPEVFTEDGWVKIIVKGEWLGNPDTFDGWTIYITSWDYDGIESRFRPLMPEPKTYIMGDGNPDDPYIMDDCWLKIGKYE